jgi:hypothetical protein
VELREPGIAVVHGQRIAFDVEAEGLSWPNLQHALGRGPGDTGDVTLAVAREVPMRDLLRAVWTLRAGDLYLQTRDSAGQERSIVLRAKPAVTAGCHVALFVGDLGVRVASPAGLEPKPTPDAVPNVIRWVDAARARCPLRYVALGAETNDASWGAVFDLALALDDAKAAGPARFVLAEAFTPKS